MWGQSLVDLFTKVGFTRWPLLICSIIGVAIIIERGIYYWRIRFNYGKFSRELSILLRQQQLMKGIHFCQRFGHPVAHVAGTYLKNLLNKHRESILSREATIAMEKVERRLRGLASITHIAPLLGLLGTVTGLVTAFHQIELMGGQVQSQDLAGGIWEALISTVFGLVIAIPCMIAYHSYESQADKAARQMQAIVSELDAFFGNPSGKDYKTVFPEKSGDQMNVVE